MLTPPKTQLKFRFNLPPLTTTHRSENFNFNNHDFSEVNQKYNPQSCKLYNRAESGYFLNTNNNENAMLSNYFMSNCYLPKKNSTKDIDSKDNSGMLTYSTTLAMDTKNMKTNTQENDETNKLKIPNQTDTSLVKTSEDQRSMMKKSMFSSTVDNMTEIQSPGFPILDPDNFIAVNKKNYMKRSVRERRRNYKNPGKSIESPQILENQGTQIIKIVQISETSDENDETSKKAKNVLNIIKKAIRTEENTTTSPTQQHQSNNGNSTLSSSPKKKKLLISQVQNYNNRNKEKKATIFQIDDPYSILHLANYQQNQEIKQYMQVAVEDNRNILKINVPDTLTYFRLQHEISEMKRKENEFKDQLNTHLHRNSAKNLCEYDKKLHIAEASIEERNEPIEERIKSTKRYKKGMEIGKLLKQEKPAPRRIAGLLFASDLINKKHQLNNSKLNAFVA